MTWILMEGLDRTGKSTVSELYKKQGFKVIHMSAPSKKYKQPGYSGPSFLDDMLEMYMELDGKDVFFDRSIYGECIWPYIYNRESMLSEEDIEVLQEFEERNQIERILMIDPDAQSHWQRCVDNKEPLTLPQFKTASILFNKMAHKYGFLPRELKDYDTKAKDIKQNSAFSKQEDIVKSGQSQVVVSVDVINGRGEVFVPQEKEDELDKLEKANAIRDVLSKRILKQKGGAFDKLEDDVKTYLKSKLSEIFSDQSSKVSLSEEEVTVLKLYCKQILERAKK